jgi:hypothetical protein
MTEQDAKLLTQEILNRALNGQALTFRPIVCWSEFRYYRGYARSTKLVIKTLKTSANRLFKEYCKEVIAGISDITKLLAYEQLLDIADFYETDLVTVNQMLDDYDEYLGNWFNFFDALLGGRRKV